MEDAWLIREFLPLSFKSKNDQEYIEFLWDAFQSNYENGKYQFAYLAFHMLVMSFVYFTIWQIKKMHPEDFDKALVGFERFETDFAGARTPFAFSIMNEKTIFRFLKLIGSRNDKIGKYKALVEERNNVAHSNGNIFFNAQETLDEKIAETMSLVDEIEEQSKAVIVLCYEKFLIENFDPDTREFPEPRDQIREVLVHENYFSRKDIEFCRAFDITSLSHCENFLTIQTLHHAFLAEYQTID